MNIETKQPVLGKFLNGRYKVIQVLSTGDFGQTYVAEDSWISGTPQCVVKFFQPQGHHPKRWEICKRRFTSDAEAIRKLGTHEQIPQFLDAFEDEQGFYLVRELIVGESLSTELPFDLYDNKRWSEVRCLELLEDVLSTLAFVHSQGIIHGDIKPSNLIRRLSDGKLILIDFGVAHSIHPSQVKSRVVPIQPAIAPVAIPPLGYIPAEQFSGQLCPSSDLYALGMIAIQALTGLDPLQFPINPSSNQISWQMEAAVSNTLASVLNGMVQDDFKNRYQSASDVQAILQSLETRARCQTSPPDSDPPKSPKEIPLPTPLSPEGAPSSPFLRGKPEEATPLISRGTLSEFSPHPSCSPLKEERSKDEAFYSLGGWGGSDGLKTDSRSKEQALTTEELSDSSSSDVLFDLPDAKDLGLCFHHVSQLPQSHFSESALMKENSGVEDVKEEETGSKISPKWEYARDLAIACWPKIPPVVTGIGAGIATSNALAISFGLYSLLHTAPANPALDILERATQQYQAGNFEEAIALAKSIPTDSAVYQKSVTAVQEWRSQWNKAEAHFKTVEQAFQEGRWRDVIEESRNAPEIAYWQYKLEALVEQAKPEVEVEAQHLLKEAYQLAARKDFTGAISLIKQIPPETPTGSKIQPKLKEYTQKQQIKAERLLQQAYQQASQRDFQSALKYLSQIPQDTPSYETAQAKMAEYSRKQDFQEEVERQVKLTAKFSPEDIKLSKLPQSSNSSGKSSKVSSKLNPGNHLKEVTTKLTQPTPTKPARR